MLDTRIWYKLEYRMLNIEQGTRNAEVSRCRSEILIDYHSGYIGYKKSSIETEEVG